MLQNAETVLSPNLDSGERLLWSGQPLGGVRLGPGDAFTIPFSLLWCGFVVFWESMAVRTHAPIFFKLWGVPFLVVGLYMVFGRFFADARARARTFYGVTNERILIVRGGMSREVKSLPLRTLGEISLVERGDRSGTIRFGSGFQPDMPFAYGARGYRTRYGPPAFSMIDRAKDVYEIIRQAQKAAK